MFWKFDNSLFRKLQFRLTLFYAGLSFGLPAIAFLLIYINLGAMLSTNLDNELSSEISEWESIHEGLGLEGLAIEFAEEGNVLGNKNVICRYLTPDLTSLASSDLSEWKALPPPPESFLRSQGYEAEHSMLETHTFPHLDHGMRTIWSRDKEGNIYQFSHSLEETVHTMAMLREVFLVAALIMLVVGGGAGYIMAKRAVKGLNKITQAVHYVSQGDFSHRIPDANDGEEIETLAHGFNNMQDRIRILIREIREVNDNIAHDLRSPLTRIRGVSEMLIREEHSPQELHNTLTVIIEECDRLVALINTMLEITEVESGREDYLNHSVALSTIVRDAVDLFQAVAEDKQVSLDADLPDEGVHIKGETSKLQRVISNLLDNAIKYTPPGGEVLARLGIHHEEVTLEIIDSGAGISESDLPKIFDRFFRGDASRSSEGNGLGLSYVKSVVQAHGGKIHAESIPGQGSLFRLAFPG